MAMALLRQRALDACDRGGEGTGRPLYVSTQYWYTINCTTCRMIYHGNTTYGSVALAALV